VGATTQPNNCAYTAASKSPQRTRTHPQKEKQEKKHAVEKRRPALDVALGHKTETTQLNITCKIVHIEDSLPQIIQVWQEIVQHPYIQFN
jgi:hypothetical protein